MRRNTGSRRSITQRIKTPLLEGLFVGYAGVLMAERFEIQRMRGFEGLSDAIRSMGLRAKKDVRVNISMT